MELSRENVLKVLSAIIETDLKKDIVSANLVEDIQIQEGKLAVKVLVSNPAMHARKRMAEALEFNLKKAFGSGLLLYQLKRKAHTEKYFQMYRM